jgi:catechol 2,3-dioxygenase-like lactoylglutathione lyase family enzyme
MMDSRGRRRPAALAALLILLAALPATGAAIAYAGAPASSQRPAPLVTAVEAPGLTVSQMERSIRFFSEVLSFEKTSDVEIASPDYERLEGVFGARMRVVRMRLGGESIDLTEYLAPKGRPVPIDSRSNDRWFQHIAIVVSDMDRAYAWLRRHDVEHASTAPQTLPAWNRPAAGIRAFYFKDPDGHALEILQFPEGKGDPRWQRGGDRLFLGIDHTAIVVGDTAASLRFYRDLLGLRVAGESENYGTEQEHLNNVFGARLRITSLRAASGPGIEFLEYLAPGDGRPRPADSRANDLIHWQTVLVTRDVEAAAAGAFTAHVPFVSPGVVSLPRAELGFGKAFLARDPDGHAMALVEKGAASP